MSDGSMVQGAAAGGAAGSFGPVLFIGLTAAALITHSDPTPPLPNPSEAMEFSADILAPAPEVTAPVDAVKTAQHLPHVADVAALIAPGAERVAVAEAPGAPLDFPNPVEAATSPVQPATGTGTKTPSVPAPALSTAALPALGGAAAPQLPDSPVIVHATLPLDLANPQQAMELTASVSFTAPKAAASPAPMPGFAAHASLPPLTGLVRPQPDVGLEGRPSLVWASVTGVAVHTREGPGTAFQSLAQFDPGTRAIVTDSDGVWSRINVLDAEGGPVTGWMFAAYLAPDAP